MTIGESAPAREKAAPVEPAESEGREALVAPLQLVSRVTDRLVRTLDFDDALEILIDGATEILGVERSSIMILDRETETLSIRVARGIDPEVWRATRIPLGEGISGTVAATGEPLVVQDIRRLSLWRRSVSEDQRADYQDFSALSVPLSIHGDVHGVMNFNHKRDGTSFGEEDLEVALLIANQAAVALYLAMLHQQFLDKQALEHELRIAAKIQERMLPRRAPELTGFSFAARSLMCHEVGGDYYDFVKLDEHRLGIAVGDVAGHGLGPAILVADARACVRAAFQRGDEIETCLRDLNRLLLDETGTEHFMTLLLAVLDTRGPTLEYATAGHHMPIVIRRGATLDLPSFGSNIPLGIRGDVEYRREEAIGLESGDLVLFFTDGAWEATDAGGRRFGDEGMRRVLLAEQGSAPERVIGAILDRAVRHRASDQAEDDYTLVAMRVEGASAADR